jgi:hypothetical protein
MEDIGIFMAIWSSLRPFGNTYCHLLYFTVIWYILPVAPRKIWQPFHSVGDSAVN